MSAGQAGRQTDVRHVAVPPLLAVSAVAPPPTTGRTPDQHVTPSTLREVTSDNRRCPAANQDESGARGCLEARGEDRLPDPPRMGTVKARAGAAQGNIETR